MDPRPLEQQCWHCGLALGSGARTACPNCGTPLRPPSSGVEAPVAEPSFTPGASSQAPLTPPDGVSVERLQRDPLLTPWLRTTLLCVVIVVLLAGAGIMAGRIVGS